MPQGENDVKLFNNLMEKTNLSTSEQFPLCTFKTFNGVFKVFTAANDLVELFLKVNDLRKKLNRNETL